MDSAIASDPRTSSLDREAAARPYVEETRPTTLRDLTNGLSATSTVALDRLVEAFAIPESTIGVATLVHEVCLGLKQLQTIGKDLQWPQAFWELREQLGQMGALDLAQDAVAVQTQKGTALRDFLTHCTRPDVGEIRFLRAAKGLVAIHLVATRSVLPAALAAELKRWAQGKAPFTLRLEALNTRDLQAEHKQHDPDSQTARTLSTLIGALQVGIKSPFPASKPVTILVPTKPDESESESDSQSQDEVPRGGTKESTSDPLKNRLAEVGTAGARVFSGVQNLYHGLQTHELKHVTQKLLERFVVQEQQDEALAALLTLVTGVLPFSFSTVPLALGNGAGLRIDIEHGFLQWNLDEVTASHKSSMPFARSSGDRFVQVPLPIEIANELAARLAENPNAAFLGDLFGQSPDALAKATKAVLRGFARTSHRPTLSRLSKSWGRHVLAICLDEVYASAIGADLTVGTASNFNYAVIRARRLTEIASLAYQAVGLSGEIRCAPAIDVGTTKLPDDEHAAQFIVSALSEVREAIVSFPKHATRKRVMKTHSKIAVRILAVVKFVATGRVLVEDAITATRFDPDSGTVVIIDKRFAPYHERRVIRLPPTVVAWLKAYLSWLKLVAYRLWNSDRKLAELIKITAEGDLPFDVHPLFFVFEDSGETRPCSSADLTGYSMFFGTDGNRGRHFGDAVFRGEGIDSASIMGWMGRGNAGQELAGGWSAVVPEHALAQCRDALERWLKRLAIPDAPVIACRKLPRQEGSVVPRYIPSQLKVIPDSLAAVGAEPCPYDDLHAYLSRAYIKLFRRWRNSPAPQGWKGVALSLVLEDGVCRKDELVAALDALRTGPIHHGHSHPFVDTSTPALGLRRIWLSDITLRLTVKAATTEGFPANPQQVVLELDQTSGGREISGSQDFTLSCAQAYLSLRVPGAIRAWCNGDIHARTTRPETIARHLTDLCERPDHFAKSSRRRATRDNVGKLMLAASDQVQRGAKHETALAWLASEIETILGEFDDWDEDALLLGFCRHLAKTLENVSTLERYVSASRPFVRALAEHVAQAGWGHVAWRELVSAQLAASDAAKDDAPMHAAIQHCLRWLQVDLRLLRRTGAPPSSFKYADYPSSVEIERARLQLEALSTKTGDDFDCASLALELMGEAALRWDEVSHLRLIDLCLDPAWPHLVVTEESGADLKSPNAPRVCPITSASLVGRLERLCQHRRARFPGDGLVPLFGDSDDPRSLRRADQVHSLVDEALWRATGSSHLRPHNTRNSVIDRQHRPYLDPALERDRAALPYRQGLFVVSAGAGHGYPSVTIGCYGVNFDLYRRQWVDQIHQKAFGTPSSAFLESITGIASATYRKRWSRASQTIGVDYLEGFSYEQVSPESRLNLRDLRSLVSSDLESLAWRREAITCGTEGPVSMYLGLRLLDEDIDTCRKSSCIDSLHEKNVEKWLATERRARVIELEPLGGINRQTFVKDVLDSGILAGMTATCPHPEVLVRLADSVERVDAPWRFTRADDVLSISAWAHAWKAARISPVVLLRSSGRSSIDADRLAGLKGAGFEARLAKARHFQRGTTALLKFFPTDGARLSRQATFLLSVFLLSLVINKKELNHA